MKQRPTFKGRALFVEWDVAMPCGLWLYHLHGLCMLFPDFADRNLLFIK